MNEFMPMTDTFHYFQNALLAWFDVHGRHDLPWQVADDPYRVWVSEIMLQQTQVKTVLQYYAPFIARFPNVEALARADWEEIAPYWAGLGYYARARNLHKASQVVAQQGHFPQTVEEWQQLAGIGRSTAGALMSLGLRKYGVILDGNVKRVLARFFAIDDDLTKSIHDKKMWQLAEQLCPIERNADYTQAIMDLGATVCTPKKALCTYCPLSLRCLAYQQNLVDELPYKKPKKAPPIRQASVIIFQRTLHGEVQWLWQQRPNHGLWGGLWCLPIVEEGEHDEHLTLLDDISADIDAKLCSAVPQNITIQHQFTHFTWQLQLKMFHVEHQYQPNIDGTWLTLADIQQKGIPTAMKKLLNALSL